MCFTLKGRLTARLVSLFGPALAALVFSLATGRSDYWALFVFMAVVGLLLDVSLYNWLIGYQARWLTILLGVFEYFILHEVVMWPWPYPFIVRLFESEAAWFYVVGWVLAQIIVQAIMPLLWLSWGDDGGELRVPGGMGQGSGVWGWQWGTLAERRRAVGLGLLGLGLAWLPTLIGSWLRPAESRFTGLLMNTEAHLAVLADLTRRLGYIGGPSGALADWVRAWPDFLEVPGELPLIPIYHVARLVVSLLALAGAYSLAQRLGGAPPRGQLWLVCGLLYALLLPALIAATPPTILLLAVVSLVLAALPLRGVDIGRWAVGRLQPVARYLLLAGLLAPGLAVWLMAWAGLARSPVAYLDEGEWQALAWLHQSTATDALVVTGQTFDPLVSALTGRQTIPTPDPTRVVYVIAQGDECARSGASFQSRSVCVWWLLPQ
jgi:hypothetical protein